MADDQRREVLRELRDMWAYESSCGHPVMSVHLDKWIEYCKKEGVLVYSASVSGYGAAILEGIKQAKGEYIIEFPGDGIDDLPGSRKPRIDLSGIRIPGNQGVPDHIPELDGHP